MRKFIPKLLAVAVSLSMATTPICSGENLSAQGGLPGVKIMIPVCLNVNALTLASNFINHASLVDRSFPGKIARVSGDMFRHSAIQWRLSDAMAIGVLTLSIVVSKVFPSSISNVQIVESSLTGLIETAVAVGIITLVVSLTVGIIKDRKAVMRTLRSNFTDEEISQFHNRFGKAGIMILMDDRYTAKIHDFIQLVKVNHLDAFEIWLFYHHELNIAENFVNYAAPILMLEGYALDRQALLSRPLLTHAIQEANRTPLEIVDHESGERSRTAPFNSLAVNALTRSDKLTEFVPVPKKKVRLQTLLQERFKEELALREIFDQRVGAQIHLATHLPDVPINEWGRYDGVRQLIKEGLQRESLHRERMLRLDDQIVDLRRAMKPEDNVLLPSDTDPELDVPPFPQLGSTPGKTPLTPSAEVLQAGEFLLHFLGDTYHRGSSHPDHPVMLVVGHDIRYSGVGASLRWAKYEPPRPPIVISGGKGGGLLPPGFETEADFLREVIQKSGIDIPDSQIHMQRESKGVYEHVNKALKYIAGMGIPVDCIIVSQAPMQQMRVGWILLEALEKTPGLNKAGISSVLPFFRDFYVAPRRWSLPEWRRRLLYEGPREISMIIGAQEDGSISPTKEIPMIYLESALIVGRHILADMSIGEKDRSAMEQHLRKIQLRIVELTSIKSKRQTPRRMAVSA